MCCCSSVCCWSWMAAALSLMFSKMFFFFSILIWHHCMRCHIYCLSSRSFDSGHVAWCLLTWVTFIGLSYIFSVFEKFEKFAIKCSYPYRNISLLTTFMVYIQILTHHFYILINVDISFANLTFLQIKQKLIKFISSK